MFRTVNYVTIVQLYYNNNTLILLRLTIKAPEAKGFLRRITGVHYKKQAKSTAGISPHTGSTVCPKILKRLSSYTAVWVEAVFGTGE